MRKRVVNFVRETIKFGLQSQMWEILKRIYGPAAAAAAYIIDSEILRGILVGIVTFAAFDIFRSAQSSWIASLVGKLPWGGRQNLSDMPTQKPIAEPVSEQELQKGVQLSDEQAQKVLTIIQAERNNARYWEFRFLTMFLMPHTFQALVWLACQPAPVAVEIWHHEVAKFIPDAGEMNRVKNALQSHALIEFVGSNIQSSQKGKDWLAWVLPKLPQTPTATS